MSDFLSPSKHASPLSFFLKTNRREVKWLALVAFCYSAAMASMLGAAYFVGRVVDLLSPTPHGDIQMSLILIVVCVAGYELGFRLGHILEIFVNSRIRAVTKKTLFDHVTSLSFGYFADRFSGQIAHKISVTTDALEHMANYITNMFVEEGLSIIVSAILLALINPYLGLFMFVWGILLSLGVLPYAKRMNARANEYAEVESKTTGIFVDFFTNIAAVKVYGQDVRHESAYAQIEAEQKAFRRLGLWNVLATNYMGISIIVLTGGLVAITTLLFERNLVTVGEIVFITGIALRAVSLAWELGGGTISFIRERGECQQNLKDLIVAPTVLDGGNASFERHDQVAIDYRDVTFGYDTSHPILHHLSLSIMAGEKLGIVGLSGAGKTTLAGLLLRFFDAQEGSVLLNGVEVRDLLQEYLRSHISYISQDTSLFHMTIAENIAYGSPEASPEEIKEASRLAYADEFIQQLPEKYESIVGERGIKLSGGQRQRVAIARAILANRPLFLLDEATSALDSDSEGKIQSGLASLMEGKTVIAIAHRLSTLSHMDRIIFLEGGEILENGTHEELIQKNGKYAALWRMQAGGFLP
ncbi:MAG: transporter ATP-binding protein [Parcubacteria group bacterium]|nr:transporter ATP-binding protein [Parcubacteria group bacterium]